MRYFLLLPLILFFSLSGCKENTEDKYLYELNETNINNPQGNKGKRKSEQQYIAILYANLFQRALSADDLGEIEKCIASIGDKEIAHEVVVSNFMNKPDVVLPSATQMRNDIDAFVVQTYKRFFVREPSIAEKVWWRNYITSNPQVTPELVYVAFALSEEYLYY